MTDRRLVPPTLYRSYLLGLLVVILAFNFMDRWALGLVLQDIKAELNLTDTQLGFLTGIAFALFYSFMGLPIARWADRGNRITIISLTTALWSVAVSLCGLAGSFMQLLLIRVGVGVGEAGGFVPGYSLLADYFTRAERPRALAIYSLGGSLSIIFGYLLGGWLNEHYGWRVMFITLGAPGLLLAGLARFSLKEPRNMRKLGSNSISSVGLQSPVKHVAHSTLTEVFARLWSIATYRHLVLSSAVILFFTYGTLQWQPTFFIRSYGLTGAQIAPWFALTYGVSSALGTYLGGAWASRYAIHNEPLQLKVFMMAMVGTVVLSVSIYLSPNRYIALWFMGWVMFFLVAMNGPMYAMIQTLVPGRMRATAIAIVYLFGNLIGMGLGPLAVGVLSDALRPWAGEESLRYALLILSVGFLWAGWHAWRASKTVAHDLARALSETEDSAANAEGGTKCVGLVEAMHHNRRIHVACDAVPPNGY